VQAVGAPGGELEPSHGVAAVRQQWQLQQQGGHMLIGSTQPQQQPGESAVVCTSLSSLHSLQHVLSRVLLLLRCAG
jgi:hypothetical protein